ncbi:leucine-rich repeat domain-containing protein [Mariniflexile ostreae]|uniref:Leucine-rich repeat domain-containing protein n=1 Tax=Mariniflexile ostreae TaxID=1520892 RepID=A0ABV5F9J9_9FLAO
MKKTLLLFMTLLTVTLTNAQLAFDETFEQGIFKYKVTTLADPVGSPNTVNLTGTVDGATIPEALVIPASVTEGGIEYAITIIGEKAFFQNTTITSLVVEGATRLAGQAFAKCTALKTVDLPLAFALGFYPDAGLTFWQCTALESINMPAMESISTGIFNGCSALTSITFPSTVTEISSVNANIFKSCTSLTEVIVEYPTLIALEKGVHANVSIFNDVTANATLTVPFGTKSTYDAADVWKDFSSIIEAAEVLGLDSSEKTALGAYPNPVVDYLHFSSNDVYSVEIYNILGAKVGAQRVLSGVDMSNLNKGVYIVKAKNNEGLDISSIKVIKQ